MNRRELLASASGAGLLAVAGCTQSSDGGDGSGGDGDGEDEDGTTETTRTTESATVGAAVSLRGTAFDPRRVSVEPGEAVEWTSEESVAHDVTAGQLTDDGESWDYSESLSEGESTTYTFESEGIYEYYCTVHGVTSMCGAVFVGDASLPEGALPCESDSGGSGGDGDGGGSGGDGDDGYY
ncbi:hypothetical protein BRD13_04825 [Halobacteriales archaeon SW_5_70_135]|nr:MAG: hypothetical protein BRD13_04825 [Halobacteriales archaeon SW_5_70_135]